MTEYSHRCELCSTPVRVTGRTTLHYESVVDQELFAVLMSALHDLTAPQHEQYMDTVPRLRAMLKRLRGEA